MLHLCLGLSSGLDSKLRQPLASRLASLLMLSQEPLDPLGNILFAASAHAPAAATFGVQLQEFFIVREMEDQELIDGALFRLATHLLLLGQALAASGDGPHDLERRSSALTFRLMRSTENLLRLQRGKHSRSCANFWAR